MPLYDYVCTACGRRMEVSHGVHDPGPTACQHCAGRLRKAVSAPAIVFKGSGWAKKDARAKASDTSESDKTAADGKGEQAAATAKPTAATDKGGGGAKPTESATSD